MIELDQDKLQRILSSHPKFIDYDGRRWIVNFEVKTNHLIHNNDGTVELNVYGTNIRLEASFTTVDDCVKVICQRDCSTTKDLTDILKSMIDWFKDQAALNKKTRIVNTITSYQDEHQLPTTYYAQGHH